MKEADQDQPNPSASLLSRNRQRCCGCRDPEESVVTYTIEDNKSNLALENLILLCEGCSEKAIRFEKEFGAEQLGLELARIKEIWEGTCEAWRKGPNYKLRIRQGERVHEIQSGEYYNTGCYELDDGGTLHIDMKSDEFVKIDIRKLLSDSSTQLGYRSYYSSCGYEFDEDFVARKAGLYAISIRNGSDQKAEVDLNVSTFLAVARDQEAALGEVAAWVVAKKEELERASVDEYVPWRILPPGEHPFPQIMTYYVNLRAQNPNARYEPERLRRISVLNPTKVILGRDEFEGYVMFCFEELSIAILDCPIVGNAIYVLRGEWERLSRLSKKDLLRDHSREVTRIVHSGDWFFRLKRLIPRRRTA